MMQRSPSNEPARGAVIFGSARTRPDSQNYQYAHETGRLLARAGLPVITGGGSGSMQAANQGALEAGGASVGVYMKLPSEPQPNPHLKELITCQSFFERKTIFFERALAFVALPGGLGTLDEISEAATHILTGRIPVKPLILLNREYWSPLLDWFANTLLKQGMINQKDLDLFQLADEPSQAVELITGAIKT